MSISGKIYFWGEKAKNAPEEPGVYAFYDKDQNLIYIEKSNNLRRDFTRFLETNFANDIKKRETKYYKREFTSRQENRVRELLERYKQEHGKLPKCNSTPEPSVKTPKSRSAFRFYEDIGRPLDQSAFNLQDFKTAVFEAPIASLEFHQKRGDFARWIMDVLEEPQLAEAVRRIDKTGEDLRKGLLRSLGIPEKAQCPSCGVETTPVKTWTMAGRPSRTHERLQLTIGHFKCIKCGKTFRRVLNKKKIRSLE